MRNLWIAIRTCPLIVNWCGIACVVLLFVKVFWLDSIPALFPHAAEAGAVVADLLSATVAAWLFLVISVQLPFIVERQHVGPHVAERAEVIANRVTGFLQMIAGSTNKGLLNPPGVTLHDVKVLFALVPPSGSAPFAPSAVMPPLTWLAAMARHDQECHEEIARIWRYARFLDSELVPQLNALEGSSHSAGMRDVREYILPRLASLTNKDLSVWADNFFESYIVARRLALWAQRYRSTYGLA